MSLSTSLREIERLTHRIHEIKRQRIQRKQKPKETNKEENKAKYDFLAFCKLIEPDYIFQDFHLEIIDTLNHYANRTNKKKNLMLNMAPGHGKSEIVSILFSAFYILRNPKDRIILASYNEFFAMEFGRRIKNILDSPAFQDLAGDELSISSDSKSKKHFHTNQGGQFLATSPSGSVTGFRANLVLFDDLVKGLDESLSIKEQDTIWRWINSNLITRRRLNCQILCIGTPWSTIDHIARFKEEDDFKEDWLHLNYPIYKNGDKSKVLWPEEYPLHFILEQKKKLENASPILFSALYELEPQREEGNLFRRDTIQYYETKEDYITRDNLKQAQFYITTDFAISKGAGDYSVFCVFAIDYKDRIYLVDMYRDREEPDVYIDKLLNLVESYNPLCMFTENDNIYKSIKPFLFKRMKEREIYSKVIDAPRMGDKEQKSISIRARFNQRKVYFHEDITDEVEKELLAFPGGKNDDIVDNFSLIGLFINNLIPGLQYREEKEKQHVRIIHQ